jgi:hypothetical protein
LNSIPREEEEEEEEEEEKNPINLAIVNKIGQRLSTVRNWSRRVVIGPYGWLATTYSRNYV